MSLLDRGPHTVVVTPMEKVRNNVGGFDWTPGTPVTVARVMVQPTTVEESEQLGLQVNTAFRVIGRGPWPGGPYSRVDWGQDPQPEREFDQVGEARVYSVRRRTAHFDVILKARGAEVR